jgi:Flp pilus assembly protein TadG
MSRLVARQRPSGRRVERERGAAVVELAILMPLLALIICGIIDFGRALNAQVTITQAAREGVRLAAMNQSNVAGRTQAAATGLSNVSVTVNTTCPVGASQGTDAKVTVTYPFTFVTPVSAIAKMFGGSGMSAPTLSSTGVMACEG